MAKVNDTDKFLVNRNNQSYQIQAQNIMADLQDTDLMLVNRGGVSYKATGADIKSSLGEPSISPNPGDVTGNPGFDGGNGTQANPYIIPTGSAFPYGGSTESSVEITFSNATFKDVIRFVDENEDTNGEVRFLQPLGVVGEDGTYTTRLYYTDTPTSSSNKTYTALLSVGESVYFQWSVLQSDLVAPVIDDVVIKDTGNSLAGFGGNTFKVEVDYSTDGKPAAEEAISLEAITSASVRPGTSDMVSSQFLSTTTVEYGLIKSDVLIQVTDINYQDLTDTGTFDSSVQNGVQIGGNTTMSWLGFHSASGKKFCPQLKYHGYTDRQMYYYFFTSDTGQAGTWEYLMKIRVKKDNLEQYNTPYGAAKYWLCFASSLGDIDTNEGRGGIYNYRPNETSGRYENPAVKHLRTSGDLWGVQEVVLSDDTNLSMFYPGETIFHTDSEYVTKPLQGNEKDKRYQTWYVEMEQDDTYPPIISEDTVWKYLNYNFWVNDTLSIPLWCNASLNAAYNNQPTTQIKRGACAPDVRDKGAIIYDLGEFTASKVVTMIKSNKLNVSFSADGAGWSPVSNNQQTYTAPAGTRWIAVMPIPGEETYSQGNATKLYVENVDDVVHRVPSNIAQCAAVDVANKTVYLSQVEGSFSAGSEKSLIQMRPVFDENEGNQAKVYPWLDANGNITAIKSTPQDPVTQNSSSPNITFPATVPGDIPVNSILSGGTSLIANVTATNSAGSDSASSAPFYPTAASITVSYNAMKWGNNDNDFSFRSDPFSFDFDEDMVFWLLWAEGASTTGGNATRQEYTENGWYSGISGGKGGWGDDGNKSPGGNGMPPRGGFYLSYRRYTRVKITGVNGSGGVTSYEVLEEGKGLNGETEGQSKGFVGGSGSGVEFTVVKDPDSKLTTVSGIGVAGSGYSVNDVVEWEEVLGRGAEQQMDLDWDQILHGFAGKTNKVVGMVRSSNNSSVSENTLLDGKGVNMIPKGGGNGASQTCDYCRGGAGGSAGWGAGGSVGGGKDQSGYSAASGYSTYASGISGEVTRGGEVQAFVLYLNDGIAATYTENNQIHSLYVRDFQ